MKNWEDLLIEKKSYYNNDKHVYFWTSEFKIQR